MPTFPLPLVRESLYPFVGPPSEKPKTWLPILFKARHHAFYRRAQPSVYRLEEGALGTGRPLCAPAVTDPLKAPRHALPPFLALTDPADSIGLLQLLLKHGVLCGLERAQALFKQPHVIQRIAEKRDHKRTRLDFLWRGI